MPNESGFVDFNQYFDQNQSEEQRLMSEAMDRARGSDAAAQSALTKSQREAAGHLGPDGRTTYNPDGTMAGDTGDITQTASYGAYLDAKKKAVDAYSGIGDPSSNPFSSAVQGALLAKNGMQQQATDALGGMAMREGNAAAGVSSRFAGQQAKEGADATYRTDQAKTVADRKAADDKLKAAQDWNLKDRISKLWAAHDRASVNDGQWTADQQAGTWSGDDYADMDELRRRSMQNGTYADARNKGAFDKNTSYEWDTSGTRQYGSSNSNVQGGNSQQGRVARTGGFKGWGH